MVIMCMERREDERRREERRGEKRRALHPVLLHPETEIEKEMKDI